MSKWLEFSVSLVGFGHLFGARDILITIILCKPLNKEEEKKEKKRAIAILGTVLSQPSVLLRSINDNNFRYANLVCIVGGYT